jgi:hypothetical protein
MCRDLIRIKSTNPYNVTECYVPCGQCAECRARSASDWSIRLRSEMDYYREKQGFQVGFLTLTYRDDCLPVIPRRFFKKNSPFDKTVYTRIPCFDTEDIRRFFNTIRMWFWRERHLKNAFRFFVTTEYGEKTHRPHYHAIIMYHPSVDSKTMYDVCSDAWCGTNMVIAQNKKNEKLKRRFIGLIHPYDAFVPRDAYACGNYVAKYVCKDLEFHETVGGHFSHLSKKARRELRRYMPFHRQSLGFGSCVLKDKSNDELVAMYRDGIDFFGDKKMYRLPRYLREKLLFRTYKYYDVRRHKERTYKLYTDWFSKNRKLVYDEQVKSMRAQLDEICTREYWTSKKMPIEPDEACNDCRCLIDYLRSSGELDEFVKFGVVYLGVPLNRCHTSDNPEDLYFARYNPSADLSGLPVLDEDYWSIMKFYWDVLKGYMHLERKETRSEQDAFIAEVRAFFNSMR